MVDETWLGCLNRQKRWFPLSQYHAFYIGKSKIYVCECNNIQFCKHFSRKLDHGILLLIVHNEQHFLHTKDANFGS